MQPHAPIRREALFEGHALFGDLAPAELHRLLSHARLEHYQSGRTIFMKGSPAQSMMAVVAGHIKISTPAPAGREVVLAIINAGDIFGEIALLDGGARTADATALSDCDLLVIDRRDFIPFLERHSDLCMRLLKLLCQRLRQTDDQIEAALFERLDTRLARALMRLATAAATSPPGSSVHLHVSQHELAGMIGATRERVNKQLHAWQREGLVDLGKRLITISNLSAIEALS
jgi:CRP/FNR family transcriptional regulator, cyclic AMP receptor protein